MTENDSKRKTIYMPNKEFFWLLFGIWVAFMFQVFYDLFGFPSPRQRAIVGISIGVISAVVILGFGAYVDWKAKKKRELRDDPSIGDDI